MTLDSLNTIIYTSLFIIPGFIIISLVQSANPTSKNSDTIYFIKCLLFSLINAGLWGWLYVLELRIKQQELFLFVALITTLLSAAITGVIIAKLNQIQLLQKILKFFKLNPAHSIPDAWDYIFSEQKSTFLIVTLIDGTKIKGWFGNNSFASSANECRDLFLSNLYYKNGDDEWFHDDESTGVYIAKDQIQYIEFLKGENDNDKQ